MTESIIGKKFAKLTVIDKAVIHAENEKRFRYICKCECGNETFVRKDHLITGRTKSCGKCNSQKFAGKTIEELAEESGLSTDTIRKRIKKGLPLEQVIAPPAPRYQKCGGGNVNEESPLNIPYYWQVQDD
jgi:hypothetical protein